MTLWLLAQATPTAAGPSKELLALYIAGAVTIIGSLTTGVISILTTLRATKKVEVAAVAAQVRGKSQDRQLRKIHLLTNSRLSAALKLLARMTKKEADRTGDPDDIAAYNEAKKELDSANQGTVLIEIEEEAEASADAAENEAASK